MFFLKIWGHCCQEATYFLAQFLNLLNLGKKADLPLHGETCFPVCVPTASSVPLINWMCNTNKNFYRQ